MNDETAYAALRCSPLLARRAPRPDHRSTYHSRAPSCGMSLRLELRCPGRADRDGLVEVGAREGHAKVSPRRWCGGEVTAAAPAGRRRASRAPGVQCGGERPPAPRSRGVTVTCGQDADCTAAERSLQQDLHGPRPGPPTRRPTIAATIAARVTPTARAPARAAGHQPRQQLRERQLSRRRRLRRRSILWARERRIALEPLLRQRRLLLHDAKDDCRKDADCWAGGDAFNGKGKALRVFAGRRQVDLHPERGLPDRLSGRRRRLTGTRRTRRRGRRRVQVPIRTSCRPCSSRWPGSDRSDSRRRAEPLR